MATQQYTLIYEAKDLPFKLTITQEGKLYVVRYGHEITHWHRYHDALECFKVCLTHALQCEGKFDSE